MTTVRELVGNNIPRQIASARDYTGSAGWVHLCNRVLRRFVTEELAVLEVLKEKGVEVDNGFFIPLPSDFSSQATVYDPYYLGGDSDVTFPYSIVNGKIRLRKYFAKDAAPSTFVLSGGTTTQITIDSTDAEENQYRNNLLVFSNGLNSGNTVLVGEHEASDGSEVELSFCYPLSISSATSTTGYITQTFLMLKYMAKFQALTVETDTLPVNSDFENALISGLLFYHYPVDSKERQAMMVEYERELRLLSVMINTPDVESIRSVNRPMAGLDGPSAIYSGAGDDE